jgi:hypothetical protein
MAEATMATAQSTIEGHWVRLLPATAYAPAALEELMYRLGRLPEMVAPGMAGVPAGSRFGEPAIIVDTESGDALGVISNIELGDFPGVVGLVIYVDEQRARAGYAMEAYFRYVERIFELGATKVQMEVMSFNAPVHRIMRKIGARPEAVLREHFYIAGRHWDATLYGFDRQAWQQVDRRYRGWLSRPRALASSRQNLDVLRNTREESPMKVDYLILADAAIVADGKHYLHGAGWESLNARSFPALHPHMSAALRLRVPAGGAPSHRIGANLVNPAGMSILTAPIYTDIDTGAAGADPPAEDQAFTLVFNFEGLRFTTAGTYAVVVTVDGAEAHRADFQLRQISEVQGVGQ